MDAADTDQHYISNKNGVFYYYDSDTYTYKALNIDEYCIDLMAINSTFIQVWRFLIFLISKVDLRKKISINCSKY